MLRVPEPGGSERRLTISTRASVTGRTETKMAELAAAPELTAAHIEYLASQLLGRLATAGTDHKPHVVPTSFRYNSELGTLDLGGHRMANTKKYRDVQATGWAAFVVDDLVSV